MFSNFSSFLAGSLRILNIANRALPLVKEISPTIYNFRKKFNNANLQKINLLPKPNVLTSNNATPPKTISKNNSLTFFR